MDKTPTQLAAEQKLSEYDINVVIDKSGSMSEPDMPGGRTRWDAMQETAIAFTRDVCAIDSDGIGVVLFSGTSIVVEDGCDVSKIRDAFATLRPSGSTPLHAALEAALKMAGKSSKKDLIVVWTDGAPDDKAAVAEVIKRQANRQESDDDCTILFIQIGYDQAATRYLQSLDDDLKGAKFDIVDAKTMADVETYASTADLLAAALTD